MLITQALTGEGNKLEMSPVTATGFVPRLR